MYTLHLVNFNFTEVSEIKIGDKCIVFPVNFTIKYSKKNIQLNVICPDKIYLAYLICGIANSILDGPNTLEIYNATIVTIIVTRMPNDMFTRSIKHFYTITCIKRK